MDDTTITADPATGRERSTGELMKQLSEDVSRLAVTARKRRRPLAVAAGAAALGSIAAVIARWRRR